MTVCNFSIFVFDEETHLLHLVAESPYHDHCLLQVSYFIHQHKLTNQRTAYVISGSTDGRIAIWDITRPAMDFYQTRTRIPTIGDTTYLKTNKRDAISAHSLINSYLDVNIVKQDVNIDIQMGVHEVGCMEVEEQQELLLERGNSVSATSSKFPIHEADDALNPDEDDDEADDGTSLDIADAVVELSVPLLVISAHQSGVNSLDIHLLEGIVSYI